MSATEYGLACLELEADRLGCDRWSRCRALLAMFAIWRWGRRNRSSMAPGDGRRSGHRVLRLTEPTPVRPRSMRSRALRDGNDWVIDGRKMWITNGSVASAAVVWAHTDEGIRGFVVPTDTPGFSAR